MSKELLTQLKVMPDHPSVFGGFFFSHSLLAPSIDCEPHYLGDQWGGHNIWSVYMKVISVFLSLANEQTHEHVPIVVIKFLNYLIISIPCWTWIFAKRGSLITQAQLNIMPCFYIILVVLFQSKLFHHTISNTRVCLSAPKQQRKKHCWTDKLILLKPRVSAC